MNEIYTYISLNLKSNLLILSILIAFGSFLLILLTIPKIVYVAQAKQLTSPILVRSSHTKSIPSLGGVSFFMCLVIFISVIEIVLKQSIGYNLLASISIMFMVGLKDDLVNTSAKIKLYGQLLASIFIIFSPTFQISNLNGAFGLYQINPIVSIIFSSLFLIFIINAYNLIDGIDGLAAIIGSIIFLSFMCLFYIKKDYFFFLLCLVAASTLLSFLKFNLSSGRLKIFMGDCGSLLIGLLIGACVLHYLSTPLLAPSKRLFLSENRLLFATAVLFIPIFDTLRIITIRIANGESPFTADRNHLHHVLLDRGFSHLKASLSLGGLNISVILFFFIVSNKFNNWFTLLSMLSIYLFSAFLFYRIKNKTSKLSFK